MTTQMTRLAVLYREPDIRHRIWVLLFMATLWLPLGGLPLWRYVYGFTGELTPAKKKLSLQLKVLEIRQF